MNTSWVQLLIFAMFLIAPALSWVVQKLREQAEVKRVRAEAQRRREEELRTGRISGSPEPPKLRSKSEERMTELQRLAERRQQQLRELRARQEQQSSRTQVRLPQGPQAGGSQAGQRLPKGTGMRGQTLPGRPVADRAPIPAQPQRQRGAPRPAQTQSQPAAPSRQPVPQARQQGPRPSPVQPGRASGRDTVSIQAALRKAEQELPIQLGRGRSIAEQLSAAPVSEEAIARPAARGTARRGVAGEVRSLLRGAARGDRSGPKLATLLAVNEVLSKPVSLRQPAEDGQG